MICFMNGVENLFMILVVATFTFEVWLAVKHEIFEVSSGRGFTTLLGRKVL